jgi:hypothetical protein
MYVACILVISDLFNAKLLHIGVIALIDCQNICVFLSLVYHKIYFCQLVGYNIKMKFKKMLNG